MAARSSETLVKNYQTARHRIPEESNQRHIVVALLAACFVLVFSLVYSSTLKMEATCSSETSVHFHLTTGCYIPEDRSLLWDMIFLHSFNLFTLFILIVQNSVYNIVTVAFISVSAPPLITDLRYWSQKSHFSSSIPPFIFCYCPDFRSVWENGSYAVLLKYS
jgi:hypothetical protein